MGKNTSTNRLVNIQYSQHEKCRGNVQVVFLLKRPKIRSLGRIKIVPTNLERGTFLSEKKTKEIRSQGK